MENQIKKLLKYCEKGNIKEIKKLNLTLEDIRSWDNSALKRAS